MEGRPEVHLIGCGPLDVVSRYGPHDLLRGYARRLWRFEVGHHGITNRLDDRSALFLDDAEHHVLMAGHKIDAGFLAMLVAVLREAHNVAEHDDDFAFRRALGWWRGVWHDFQL